MVRAAGFLSAAALLALGCRGSGPHTQRVIDDAGTGIDIETPDGGSKPDASTPETLPHALLSADPPHGPFSGGSLVLLRGNGFASNARVWFGASQVPTIDVIPIDAHRIQVTAPPGDPGLADLIVQNGDDASTRVTLEGGYAYDAFYADPSSGPTSGGTLVTLHGFGTQWDSATTVSVDRNPCEVVSVSDPSTLTCRAPAGTPGAKPVRVTTQDGIAVDVLDGFSYGNSDNGFRGGLSGGPLQHQLKVLAFSSIGGEAVPKAAVILGSDATVVSLTDANGVALLQSNDLGPKATITVAAKCFQPVTFVDLGVDTLTAYLDPVLSPTCFDPMGDLERGGGTTGQSSSVRGELVWPDSQEFRKNGFNNVPEPKSPDEAKTAYVFSLSSRPTDNFRLPSSGDAITPDSTGTTGYRFNLSRSPGNYTLYALAGIENRAHSPATFSAYAMGLIRGVAVPAGMATSDVFIRVDVALDHALVLNVTGPKPTTTGPDVLAASVAVRVGNEGYAILPGGQQQALLGSTQTLSFVGVPALIGSLSGTTYVASARAVTSNAGNPPLSVLGLLGTTSTDEPLTLGPFVEIPVLSVPAVNGAWDGRNLSWNFAAGGLAADLAVVDIVTASNLYDWRIVAPASTRKVTLPDLGAVSDAIAWPRGAQSITVSLAKIKNFDYSNLRYRDLTDPGWTAYASDAFFATY